MLINSFEETFANRCIFPHFQIKKSAPTTPVVKALENLFGWHDGTLCNCIA